MADDDVKVEGLTPDAEPGRDPIDEGAPTVVPIEELRKVRHEAADWRTKYREMERKMAAFEEVKMEEQQQYKELAERRAAELAEERKARETLEANLKQTALKNAVALEAARAGVVDPDDAFHLADLSNVEVGQDGTVKGVKEAIDALVAAKPYLTSKQAPARTAPPVGATNPGAPDRTGNAGWMNDYLNMSKSTGFGRSDKPITFEE